MLAGLKSWFSYNEYCHFLNSHLFRLVNSKFIQIDIRDTDSDFDLYSLFQVLAQSNLLLNNDSYKKSLFPL